MTTVCILAARVNDEDDPLDQYKREIGGRVITRCVACNGRVFLTPASQVTLQERPGSIVRCLQCGPNPEVVVMATTAAHVAERAEYERKRRA